MELGLLHFILFVWRQLYLFYSANASELLTSLSTAFKCWGLFLVSLNCRDIKLRCLAVLSCTFSSDSLNGNASALCDTQIMRSLVPVWLCKNWIGTAANALALPDWWTY
ncbi:hypothetical protein CsSME_00016417 [Camellia sinensis var. sinensis]